MVFFIFSVNLYVNKMNEGQVREKDRERIREFVQNVQNQKQDKLIIIMPFKGKDLEITLNYTNHLYYKTNVATFKDNSINIGPADGPIYPSKTTICEKISSIDPEWEEDIELISLEGCHGYQHTWDIPFMSNDKIK